MPNEGTGLFGRIFGRKNRDDAQGAPKAPEREARDPREIIEENRKTGTAIAHELENVMALAGLSKSLGTDLQKEKRVGRLRALRDGYRDMPAIETDVRELDGAVVECVTQTLRCVETGDVLTLDFSLDALEYAVRVRLRFAPQSVDIMRLFVNRSKLSKDVFEARQELEEHERTLEEIRARGGVLENELQKQLSAGKKFSEVRMERLAMENCFR